MMYTARALDASEYPAWDQLIAASVQGKTFLRSDWLQMLCETDPGVHFRVLGCFDSKGQLAGGQAFCYQERWGIKITDGYEFLYSGPVLAPSQHKSVAKRSAEHYEMLKAISATLAAQVDDITVDLQPALSDVRAFIFDGWQVIPMYSHLWHMHDLKSAWLNMSHAKRTQIRHVEKDHVFGVEESDGDGAIAAFVSLYRETMAKYDWQPSARWEQVLQARFRWMRERDGCRLYTARTADGKMAGGVIAILSRDDHSALLWRVGTSQDFVKAGGVPALYWHAACGVAAEFPCVDFGWSPQASLSQFKDYMGAQAELHFRLSRCSGSMRLRLVNHSKKLKDRVYNLLMPIAYNPWQRLRYGRTPRKQMP
ncbi:MAG: GNAT family N-acetyltransferase [Chloroflexi bacterium]|nr:GNAT family N-acetyltransferase [Chloroflexota bacterium]